MTDALSVALRALSFVFLFQAAGVAIFTAVFEREIHGTLATIRRLGSWSAIIASVAVTGHYVLEAARAAGEIAGMFDISLQQMVLQSNSGSVFAFKMLGLLLIAVGLWREDELGGTAAIIGAVLAVFAFTLTGHTSANTGRWWLAPCLTIHLLIIAFWFGALAPLLMVSRREPLTVAGRVIEAFSQLAVYLVPLILVAGVALALGLVPGLSVFAEPYGLLLIAKLVGFAVLMVLAALNKRRFGPALLGGDKAAARRFRITVGAEYALIVGVLSTTAVMTTFFSPE